MSRRRRLIRTFVPLGIACAIPLSIIWILAPLMRNSGALRREVQMTNPIIEAPPRGYGDRNPVIVGLETSLTMLHSYDFPNHRESTDDPTAWEEAVRNNLAWADSARYDVIRIGVGDAATSLATEATEWDWLIRSTSTEFGLSLYCTTPAFAAVGTVKDALLTLPWKGVVTGEYAPDDMNDLADACNERGIALYSGFSSYFGPGNEFMAGFAWDQSSQRDKHLLDARAVGNAAPGAVRNLLFLLTLQLRPDGIFTHLSTNEYAYAWTMNTNTQDMRNWYTYLRGRAGDRPLANILFDAHLIEVDSALTHFQRHFLSTIINGVGLAGHDIQITKGEPIADAVLYVIVSEDGGLSDAARSVVDGDRPVLWFPVRGVGSGGRTAPVVDAFGIRAAISVGEASRSVERIDIDDGFVRWRTENSQDRYASYTPLAADAVHGDILADFEGAPLVIRNGKNAVFNGVALHPEAAFVIARTIATLTGRPMAMDVPFNGYGVVGTRSAFFATAATQLSVRLHHDDGTEFENGTRIRVVRFSAYGNPRGRENVEYKAPFKKVLTAHELIIVEAVPS